MNTPEQTPTPLQNLLAHAQQAGKKSLGSKRFSRWWLIIIVLVIVALVFWLRGAGNSGKALQYTTEEVNPGAITVSVSASGTLKPTRAVDVGTEVSGTLESVLVRENDQVSKGQLLAQLDTSKLRDSVLKSQASVTAAEARVAQMEATLMEDRANLARMRQVAELSGGKVPAKTELDSAEASVKRDEANLKSAQADVAQANATLKTDQTNIRKATITSPVDGVVLVRKVEPGQTVAASMTTPVLFSIAEDLTQMELHVNVDEADVAHVSTGQKSAFTVAAWNNRKFPASVERVDLGSTLTDNVVTYTTVLSVNNDDLALRPGMTASAEIITAERKDVLLVPNAALRFSPSNGNGAGKRPEQSFLSRLLPTPRMPGGGRGGQGQNNGQRASGNGNGGGEARVWILENGSPKALSIQTGVNNGRFTEVLGGELKPGMAVITDYQEARP
ncbi:MAG: efflux RND transporter periplasmic adaptor subunit [Zoogloeaceae bacterium]|jgi:HlyD family secretion protein|nr:efflux RND transporter periplasmic adaptor subunit [Zoogloeaceae bacterium]